MTSSGKALRHAAFTALAFGAASAHAAEIGHYGPGVMAIRDFVVPAPGSYGALYSYFYTTDRLNDSSGNEIDSVTIRPGPGPGVTLDLDVNVDAFVLAPTFIWVSPKEILGGKYGAYVSLTLSDTSVAASLATASGSGRGSETSTFGTGDLFVQPLWLGWTHEHWDFAAGYGFYAPTGAYDTEFVTLPVVGAITVEASDNIGLGFWTHQLQGAATWYPWADQRMAVATALTYEMHGEKDDFDLTPGDNLTLNWGVSQYLPLGEDGMRLLEIGVAGYSSWQVSGDSGADATNPAVKDEVHGIGVQAGITFVPVNAALNFHYFTELDAEDRFQGESIGLNFVMKF